MRYMGPAGAVMGQTRFSVGTGLLSIQKRGVTINTVIAGFAVGDFVLGSAGNIVQTYL